MKKIYKQQLLKKAALRAALTLGVLLWGINLTQAQTYNLPITGTDAVRCGAGELTLTVSDAGVVQDFNPENVKWYTVPFYGEPIATGLSYNTGYIEFTQTFFVDYIGDGGCGQCDRLLIRAEIADQVVNPQVIYPSISFCNSASDWFTPSVVGSENGNFSISPGIGNESFNVSDGSFNPNGLTAGEYDVTYQPDVITGCNSNPVTVTLVVTDAPEQPSISYPLAAYCVSSGVVNIVSQTGATGGTYSAAPDGLAIDEVSGAIIPGASAQGDYTVTYFVPSAGGCDPVSATASIRIDAGSEGGIATATNSEISSGGSTSISLSEYVGDIQWQVSIDNSNFSDLSGESSPGYNTGSLSQTTYFRAEVTNGVCGVDYSNTATVTVSAASIAGTATASPEVICNGATTTLSLTGYTGSIQWQNNETGAFVDIPGATSESYTTAALSVTEPGTERLVNYRAVVTEGLSAPDITDTVSITIKPDAQPGIAVGDEICSGSDGTVTVFDQLGTIQWQSSPTEDGTYVDVADATSQTYTATNLAATTYYRAAITNGPCSVVYTDPVSITVYPPTIAGTASADLTQMCTGGTADIQLTGYTGDIAWEYLAPGSETWTYSGGNASFTTNPLITPGIHSFKAKVTSGVCSESYSSTLEIEVVEQPSWINYISPASSITYGESVTFDVEVDNGLGGTIEWVRSTSPGGAGIIVVSPDTPPAVGTYYYRPTFTPTGENCGLADGTEYSVEVGQKELTVINASVTTKTYNGNTDATITGAQLSGLVLNDQEDTHVVLDNDVSGTFASANVGTGINVSHSMSVSGDKAGNYTLTPPTLSGEITAKALTITPPSIASKVYDGTATAGALTTGTLSGFVGSETVTATAVADSYSSANVGTYNNVVVSYTLSNGSNGGLATNYSLANGSATGVITALQLTIGGSFTVTNKVYDGTTDATINTNSLSLTTPVSGDEVSLTSLEFDFVDAIIADGKTVSITSAALTGAEKDNYTLSLTGAPTATANITAPNVQVTSTTADEPGGGYTDLQAAFDAINIGTHTGVITVRIFVSTTEDATAVLNASGTTIEGGTSSYTSVTIIAENDISVSGAGIILGN